MFYCRRDALADALDVTFKSGKKTAKVSQAYTKTQRLTMNTTWTIPDDGGGLCTSGLYSALSDTSVGSVEAQSAGDADSRWKASASAAASDGENVDKIDEVMVDSAVLADSSSDCAACPASCGGERAAGRGERSAAVTTHVSDDASSTCDVGVVSISDRLGSASTEPGSFISSAIPPALQVER